MQKLITVAALATALPILSACDAVSSLTGFIGEPKPAPVVIAHRGASGYLPEHTLAAYALAHAQGADYLEPDLMVSKDGVLVAFHDRTLEGMTNVEEQFPSRHREDGSWYVADFTLDELKQLEIRERLSGRFDQKMSGFRIASFDEVLVLLRGLNRATDCTAGIYPELKHPAFHSDHGFDMERMVIEALAKRGYSERGHPVYLQSFDEDSLRKIRFELSSDLKLIQLISGSSRYDEMLTPSGLDEVARYADGIGPTKRRIEDGQGKPVNEGLLVQRAHERGLVVHPYTLRSDRVPGSYEDFQAEIEKFIDEYEVDGVFTDHPDKARQAISGRRRAPCLS